MWGVNDGASEHSAVVAGTLWAAEAWQVCNAVCVVLPVLVVGMLLHCTTHDENEQCMPDTSNG